MINDLSVMKTVDNLIRVAWGCCWFNETTDIVVNFMSSVLKSFKSKTIEIVPIVFVASLNIKEEDIVRLRKSVDELVLLKNRINIYPNKNYGVYSIVNFAHRAKIEYVAVVDPDWSINKCNIFVEAILQPVLLNEADIIIPNIGNAAGRDNKIIGRSIIDLFYPDYKDVIATPFPGSFSAITEKIFLVVNSDYYHFDWGGEWDIISYFISNNFIIKSADVDVENVRHRSNSSKVQDAYQMWRAVFSNHDIIRRFNNLSNHDDNIKDEGPLYKVIMNNTGTIKDIIDVLSGMKLNPTEKQLLYMILYPLSCIINNKTYDYKVEDVSKCPYDKNQLEYIKQMAAVYTKKILDTKEINVEELHDNAKKITGGYFGNWNKENVKHAQEDMLKQIEMVL